MQRRVSVLPEPERPTRATTSRELSQRAASLKPASSLRQSKEIQLTSRIPVPNQACSSKTSREAGVRARIGHTLEQPRPRVAPDRVHAAGAASADADLMAHLAKPVEGVVGQREGLDENDVREVLV